MVWGIIPGVGNFDFYFGYVKISGWEILCGKGIQEIDGCYAYRNDEGGWE